MNSLWPTITNMALSVCVIIQAFWLRSLTRQVHCLELWVILNDRELMRKDDHELHNKTT